MPWISAGHEWSNAPPTIEICYQFTHVFFFGVLLFNLHKLYEHKIGLLHSNSNANTKFCLNISFFLYHLLLYRIRCIYFKQEQRGKKEYSITMVTKWITLEHMKAGIWVAFHVFGLSAFLGLGSGLGFGLIAIRRHFFLLLIFVRISRFLYLLSYLWKCWVDGLQQTEKMVSIR